MARIGSGTIVYVFVFCLTLLFEPLCQGQIGQMGGLNGGANQGGTLFPHGSNREHLVTLTPYIDVLGTYDLTNSIAGPSSGELQKYSASAVSGEAGVDGYHSWERTTLGVTARGSYRHYINGRAPDINNEFVALGLEHRISRRTSFALTETAGSAVNAVSGALFGLGSSTILPGLGTIDQNLSSLPTNEPFDNRVYYSSTSAQVNYQQSLRLSMFAGGGGFVVRRKQDGAPGSNGGSGYGGVNYMLSRRQSVGVQYSAMKYDYTRSFGDANVHMAGIGYGVMLNQNWTFGVQGGAYRVNMAQLTRVALDPAVAALFGQSFTIQSYRGSAYRGQGKATLQGTFRRSAATLGYYRTVGAGNSIFLTSQVDGAMATYSYLLRRRCSVMVGSYYYRQTDLSGNYKPLNQYGGTGSLFYRVLDSFHLVASVGARHMDLNGPNFRPTSLTVSGGFGYSPTRGLPLW